MNDWRQRAEERLQDLGHWIHRHRWLTLAGVLLLTAPLLAQLPELRSDHATESLFHEDDPALVAYERFRARYGKGEFFVVGLGPAEVFTPEFLARLERLHAALEAEVPYLERVTSLVNVRRTRGDGDTLRVQPLLESLRESGTAPDAFAQEVIGNPFYRDYLIDRDGNFTALVLEPQTSIVVADDDALAGFDGGGAETRIVSTEEYKAMSDAIAGVLEREWKTDISAWVVGGPELTAVLDRAMARDLATFVPVSALVMVLFLSLLFRRISGVVYPLLIILLAVLATNGYMAAAGIPLTPVTTILPPLLIVIGAAYAIHILSVFYRHYDAHGDPGAAIGYALGHSGLAVIMTALTTAVGLLSFAGAEMATVAQLGYAAPVGVLFTCLFTLLLLPALIGLLPARRRPVERGIGRLTSRLLEWIADFALRRRRVIITAGGVLALVAVAGIAQIRISHNALGWFPEGSPIRAATERIDSLLHGSMPLDIVIDTGRDEGVYAVSFLRRLEETEAYLAGLRDGDVFVGRATSLTSVLKEVNRALNANNPDDYRLPDSRELVAQELLLFEMSGHDDVRRLVDSRFREVRLSLKIPFADAVRYGDILDRIRDHLQASYPALDVEVTGIMALIARTLPALLHSTAFSYSLAFGLITLLMIAMIGRTDLGLLSMVPNLLPVALVLGFMGWSGIPFDMSTMLIGSILIGLVVDDTIHYLHNFRRYLERYGNVDAAARETMLTTGRAIFITSMVLAAGFFAYLGAEMGSSRNYGLLCGLAVLAALLSDFLLTPALAKLYFSRRIRAGNTSGTAPQEK